MSAPAHDDAATPESQHQRLYRVSQAIHATLEPHEALQLVVREAVELMRAASGSLALLNPNSGLLEIEASIGLPAGGAALKLRPDEGLTGWVVRTGKAVRVDDVAQDSRYIGARDGVRAELAVPLLMEGEVRGVLNVDGDRPAAFTAADELLLTELAAMAAQVVRNTWLYQQHRQRSSLLEALVQLGRAINSSVHLDDVLQAITRESASLLATRMSSLQLLDTTGDWLVLRAQHGAGPQYQQRPPLSTAESLMGSVVRRRKPAQVENVQTSPQYQHRALAREEGLVSLLSVPLVYGQRCLGTLNVYTGAPHVFSNDEVRALTALAELSATAIEKARLLEHAVETEEQLRRNEQLAALGLLAAEVAHEIRNPLTVMKLLYHSMDLHFPAGDPRAEDARVMGEKMAQMERIMERIVGLARNAEPRFAPVNLRRLLDDLMLLTRHKLQQHRVTLVRHDDADLPPAHGDATQLAQATLNLILNAIEAMPGGGTLTLTARRAEEHVAIAVADTGHGLSAEQQQRAFSGILSSAKEGGTGLGLAIVRRVAENHNGQLLIQSAPGAGTTMTIRIPAA